MYCMCDEEGHIPTLLETGGATCTERHPASAGTELTRQSGAASCASIMPRMLTQATRLAYLICELRVVLLRQQREVGAVAIGGAWLLLRLHMLRNTGHQLGRLEPHR